MNRRLLLKVCRFETILIGFLHELTMFSVALSAILIIMLMAGGLIPVIFLMNLEPQLRQLIATGGIGIGYLVIICALFVPVLMKYYKASLSDGAKISGLKNF